MNKCSYIQAEIRVLNHDIVCICETWVPDNNLTDSFVFDNYISFADSRTGWRGGGVLPLINAKLQPRPASCNKKIYDCNQCNVMSAFIKPILSVRLWYTDLRTLPLLLRNN